MQHLVSQKSRLHAQPGQRNLAVHCGPGTPAPFMISAAASLLLVTPASAEASGPSISQPTINEQGLGKPELRGTITKQQSEFSLSSSLPAPPLLSSMDSLNKRDTRRHSQMFASTSKAPIQAEISHLHWLPIASLMESLSQPLPTYVYGLEAGAASLAASAIWMWQASCFCELVKLLMAMRHVFCAIPYHLGGSSGRSNDPKHDTHSSIPNLGG